MSAQLRLGSGSAELVWPPGDAAGVTVLLAGDERLCRSVARALGTVVLGVPPANGAAALEWVADHIAQLGGGRLILAGAEDVAGAVLALARRARDDGWPRLAHVLLVRADLVQWPAVTDLPRSARRVRDALVELGLPADIVRLADSTRTAPEAAAAVGCELGAIVKSLVMRGTRSGEPVLALVSGSNRADESLLEAALGEPVERPDAAYVRETTGYSIGGIPPIGHPASLRTLLDEDLLRYEVVWAAAGNPHAVFGIAPAALAQASGAAVTRLASAPEAAAAPRDPRPRAR